MEEGLRSTGEAAGEKVDTQEIKVSSSSLVAGIEMDTVLEHSLRGKEKMPEHSGGSNEELMDGSVSASRVEGKSNCSSSVVEMEKLLEDTSPSVEMARWKQRYIYRVPEFIKKMTNREAYQPQFVSLGPLHHGEPHLLPMEEHKRRAMLHMVNWTGKPLTEFVAAIEEVADELEAAYDGLDDRWRGVNRSSFVQMMVTDGCFLFELIKIQLSLLDDDTGYAANDPIFSRSSFDNFWPMMRNDMIVMENQIPLVVLERIIFAACSGTPPVSYLFPSGCLTHILLVAR
ncbi:uncharacterized protein LOC120644613 [Panicum virgatum]|uniref:uncharacterized protein LOC120644613 n=1 Tax=Panicum virgatum TaxID=38727 RepID=UPI0019D52EC7|nr:uncharacterized protein LOC120644613 [Panicum virgatum]